MKKNFLAFLAALGLAETSTAAMIETAYTSKEAEFLTALKANGFETLADAIENPLTDTTGNVVAVDVKKEFNKIIAAVAAEIKAEAEGKIVSFEFNGREFLVVTPKGKKGKKPAAYQREIVKIDSIKAGGLKDSKGGIRCYLACTNESNLEYELELSSNYFKDNNLFANLPTETVTRAGDEYIIPVTNGEPFYLELKVQRNVQGDIYNVSDTQLVEAVRDEFGEEFINTISLPGGEVRESVTLSFRSDNTKFHSPSISSVSAFNELKIHRDAELRSQRDSLLLQQSSENNNIIARQKSLAQADDIVFDRVDKLMKQHGLSFEQALAFVQGFK